MKFKLIYNPEVTVAKNNSSTKEYDAAQFCKDFIVLGRWGLEQNRIREIIISLAQVALSEEYQDDLMLSARLTGQNLLGAPRATHALTLGWYCCRHRLRQEILQDEFEELNPSEEDLRDALLEVSSFIYSADANYEAALNAVSSWYTMSEGW